MSILQYTCWFFSLTDSLIQHFILQFMKRLYKNMYDWNTNSKRLPV